MKNMTTFLTLILSLLSCLLATIQCASINTTVGPQLIGDPDDYFPTPVGAWWEYGVYQPELIKTLRFESRGTATMKDGREAIILNQALFRDLYILKQDGEVLAFTSPEDPQGQILIKSHLKAGDSWDYAVALKESTITVPAGTFKGTIQVKSTGMTAGGARGFNWYAPGIGLVMIETNNPESRYTVFRLHAFGISIK